MNFPFTGRSLMLIMSTTVAKKGNILNTRISHGERPGDAKSVEDEPNDASCSAHEPDGSSTRTWITERIGTSKRMRCSVSGSFLSMYLTSNDPAPSALIGSWKKSTSGLTCWHNFFPNGCSVTAVSLAACFRCIRSLSWSTMRSGKAYITLVMVRPGLWCITRCMSHMMLRSVPESTSSESADSILSSVACRPSRSPVFGNGLWHWHIRQIY